MKKLLSLLLTLALLLVLSGCNATDFLPEDLTDFGAEEYDTTLFPQENEDDWLEFEKDDPADTTAQVPDDTTEATEDSLWLDPDGSYTSKEDVALYIHLYGELPANFMTKKEARDLGWEGGSLDPYAPGMCIGGDRFGNYEGLLPNADGRRWTECDIDTLGGKSRGAKRIVFSNDGLIYYTDDHYESFELLYGEE